jgi:glycerophosphoryl diester phosphodiesterase
MKHQVFCAIALGAIGCVSQLRGVEVIGHRGASFDAPENTVASFRLGWQQQADADELDIYLTKDGEIVVIHDANTKRTAGHDATVASQTFAELRKLDAGSWKDPKFKGEKIPTLAEALATMPPGKKFFIEIKCGPEVLPKLKTVLEASGRKPEQLVLISFSYPILQEAKKQLPQYPAYWIVGYKADKKTKKAPDMASLIAKAKAAKLDGLDLEGKFTIDKATAAKVAASGLKLYVWTIDDPALARQLAAAGVLGITTNRPGWLREQLSTAK